MHTIPLHRLIETARENFERVTALAATSRPGCREARRQIGRAAKYSLNTCPYAVVRRGRDIILAGWCGAGVGALRVTRGGCPA